MSDLTRPIVSLLAERDKLIEKLKRTDLTPYQRISAERRIWNINIKVVERS